MTKKEQEVEIEMLRAKLKVLEGHARDTDYTISSKKLVLNQLEEEERLNDHYEIFSAFLPSKELSDS